MPQPTGLIRPACLAGYSLIQVQSESGRGLSEPNREKSKAQMRAKFINLVGLWDLQLQKAL